MTEKYKTISFWMPAQVILSKSAKKEDGSDAEGRRWIQGVASTNDTDLQGEIVEQDGIDFSYFMKYGYFNDDHKPGPENKIGEPTECKVTKDGLWVKGFLYQTSDKASHYWNLMRDQAVSGSKRRVGFSIQGKVLQKAGSRIRKCWIQDIAVTTQPVNASTWAEIAKSLAAKGCGPVEEEEEKALSTTSGSPLIPESLDSEAKPQIHKSLNFAEAVVHLQKHYHLPLDAAEAVAKMVFHTKRS